MKRLVILFLLSAFIFYPYASAGQEEKKGKVVIIDPDDTAMIHDWPLWLFNHGYTSYYDSSWRSNYYGRQGAIVLRKPYTFGESFVKGFSKGISMGMDNYYRAREQKRDIKTLMALIKLKWASEGKDYRPKSAKYSQPQRYFVPDREPPAVWLEKQKKKESKFSWLDKFDPLDKKEEDEFIKYMRSIGALLPWQYRTIKLNEYLKARGLSLVPTNVEVHQVHDGDWAIFWDGEKWTRKKKQEKK